MLNTHQPNVVSKRVNQDKKNQIKGLEFTLFFNQENFNMVLISKEQILIDKDPFLLNPEKPDVPLNKNDAFQKVQKRRVQEKR